MEKFIILTVIVSLCSNTAILSMDYTMGLVPLVASMKEEVADQASEGSSEAEDEVVESNSGLKTFATAALTLGAGLVATNAIRKAREQSRKNKELKKEMRRFDSAADTLYDRVLPAGEAVHTHEKLEALINHLGKEGELSDAKIEELHKL